MGMSNKSRLLSLAAFALAAAASSSAFAEEAQPLPGVKQPQPIVQAPQPEPMAEPATPGTFKVGDFDVKVSGSITVDVGVGKVKPPR
jgi:hypothetical protein